MDNQALFVDFMYAVTVGASLPRLDERVLDIRNPLLWALLFMISVFLEDFYLYHTKVAPHLKGLPSWRGFILTMLIIGTWYLSQAAFPSHERLFLASFALFFLLKLLGGLFMMPTQYPTRRDMFFLLPAATALALFCFSEGACLAVHPGRLLIALVPVWLLSVVLWWMRDSAQSSNPHTGP